MVDEFKKIFIDVYIDWCGWCKWMDVFIFVDFVVVVVMNEYFYVVKLDVEQKENIVYDNYIFIYCLDYGCRGVYEFVFVLFDGKMSYFFFVYLDEVVSCIFIFLGYKDV